MPHLEKIACLPEYNLVGIDSSRFNQGWLFIRLTESRPHNAFADVNRFPSGMHIDKRRGEVGIGCTRGSIECQFNLSCDLQAFAERGGGIDQYIVSTFHRSPVLWTCVINKHALTTHGGDGIFGIVGEGIYWLILWRLNG